MLIEYSFGVSFRNNAGSPLMSRFYPFIYWPKVLTGHLLFIDFLLTKNDLAVRFTSPKRQICQST